LQFEQLQPTSFYFHKSNLKGQQVQPKSPNLCQAAVTAVPHSNTGS